jgi:AraC-like DNA-binding protein
MFRKPREENAAVPQDHCSGPSVIYQGSAVILGETRFDAGDATFRNEAVADVWPSIAFPRVPMGIHAADSYPAFGDANTAILFSVGRPYRRISIDGNGSWTEWIEIRPDVLAEIVSDHASPFTGNSAPAPSHAHLAHRRARLRLAGYGAVDGLALEDTALLIAGEVLAAGCAVAGARRPEAGTDRLRLRRELVFDVQALLNRRLGRPLSLADISDAVDASPYHLCRVFREFTGLPIHRYRDRLRLRASLELIAERDVTLLDVALDLGYANEAHFSDAFHRAFGMRPGAYRRSVH